MTIQELAKLVRSMRIRQKRYARATGMQAESWKQWREDMRRAERLVDDAVEQIADEAQKELFT